MDTEEELRRIRIAKARFGKELLDNPDVHCVDVGYRRRDGEVTDRLAIVVHVKRKMEMGEVAPQNLLPRLVRCRAGNGAQIDVLVDVVDMDVPVEGVGANNHAATGPAASRAKRRFSGREMVVAASS